MNNEITHLLEFIVKRHNLDEIATLCFELGVDYDELGEGGKTAKVRRLLLHLGEQRQFDLLLNRLQQTRTESFDIAGLSIEPGFVDGLYAQLSFILPALKRPRDEQLLMDRVNTFWVEGVLKKSLHNLAMIELGKEFRPGAVDYPWKMVVQPTGQEPYVLPLDKSVGEVFDEANQSLLILGKPGSGKTTMLLDLTQAKSAQAELDPSLPMPVVFNLSSWTGGKSIAEWLIDELLQKYLIPKKISRSWVDGDKLLLLLDGLDEVGRERQSACVEAINDFRQEHLTGVVVCSRVEEYEAITQRLKLESAILLQSLAPEQIDEYLASGDNTLEAVHASFKVDATLEEMAKSPLMLSIMTFAYREISVEDLSRFDSTEARRQHLFATYVQQMFKRRGENEQYTSVQTMRWLSWLAERMTEHNQTLFLIEGMQPTWLSTNSQYRLYEIITRASAGFIIGLASWSFFGFDDPVSRLFLLSGLLSGIITGIIHERNFESQTNDMETRLVAKLNIRKLIRQVLGVGSITWLIVWLILWFIYSLNIGLIEGLIGALINSFFVGLVVGLIGGLIFALRDAWRGTWSDIRPVEALSWSWRAAVKGVLVGLIIGLVGELIFGLSDWLNYDLIVGPITRLSKLLDPSLIKRLLIGLIGGLIGGLRGGLHGEVLDGKLEPNQGIKLSIRNSFRIGLIGGVVSFVAIWMIAGPVLGLRVGLVVGLIGWLWYGGFDSIYHFVLRIILWHHKCIPWNYVHFLNYGVGLIFLYKTGGSYVFVHRMLLEYFAGLETD